MGDFERSDLQSYDGIFIVRWHVYDFVLVSSSCLLWLSMLLLHCFKKKL